MKSKYQISKNQQKFQNYKNHGIILLCPIENLTKRVRDIRG